VVDFGSGCLDFGVEEKEKQPDVVRWAARFLYLYTFYFIRWSIASMPTIFVAEMIGAVRVRGILED